MKVLLTAFAMDAHLNGVVPLAWALRTAGHEVRVASQPALTGSITRAGLTAVPVGTDHRIDEVMGAAAPGVFALHGNPDYLEVRPELLGGDFLVASHTMLTAVYYAVINNDSMVDDLVDFVRWWRPELVIREPFTFAGAVAAQAGGAVHARLLWGPDLFLRMYDRFRQVLDAAPAALRDDSLREWLTWTLGRYGEEFHPDVVTGQFTIDQMPPGARLDMHRPVVGMRFVPYNGPLPAVVPHWLRRDPERPRVCLTQGITERSGTGFAGMAGAGEVLEAIAELDAEVVATVRPAARAALPVLPSNVRIVDSVPLHAVLPGCAAVVHHGGAGTWATAALYGVPQLVLARQWDDVFRARRLEELGAGLCLAQEPGGGAEAVRKGLARLLEEPSFAQSAGRLRREMLATPSPNAVVPLLEERVAALRAGGPLTSGRPAGQ
ncbi:activator-dependent family glycosyltransferase [Streptomyces sp. NPDC049585]|uniref:activator-dependent family glycosyltransferase n=1 Tax=Streptomyces sp. NPDC049585 TaxID=3155154 RepID=UPI00341F264C